MKRAGKLVPDEVQPRRVIEATIRCLGYDLCSVALTRKRSGLPLVVDTEMGHRTMVMSSSKPSLFPQLKVQMRSWHTKINEHIVYTVLRSAGQCSIYLSYVHIMSQ